MKKINIIVPCYNEDVALPLFYKELSLQTNLISDYQFKFIIVNDGSTDITLNIAK